MSDARLLKTVADTGAAHPGRKQLQRVDWLARALELFIDEGIDAVRITGLADDLGVTRGSFYWHFENRKDLIDALVSFWRYKNTDAIVHAVSQAASLVDGILGFFETCIDAEQFDPRLDLAIREWSRRAEKIRALVDSEDAARIAALQAFFTRFGYPMPEALIRARVLYFAQIGFYALDTREPLATRLDYTAAYFECFSGRWLDPDDAGQFRRRILDTYGDRIK